MEQHPQCVLRSDAGSCPAKPGASGCFECKKCGRVSRPIRVIRELDKVLTHPQPMKDLVADLISSDKPSDLLFAMLGTGTFTRWELQGFGRTFEYPVDINFMAPDGCRLNIKLRHGLIDHRRTDWEPLEKPPIDECLVDPVFLRLVERLHAAGMQYLGVCQLQLVFGKKFRQDGESYDTGVIALVRL